MERTTTRRWVVVRIVLGFGLLPVGVLWCVHTDRRGEGMNAEKRQDLGMGWKLGVRIESGQDVSEQWLALIDGKSERDVRDILAALLFGMHGDSFGDFMAQRFPKEVRA